MINLTVIIPFHNEEMFLEESVNRVLKANTADKILLINDGSNDNSSNIAKRLSNENEVIKYYEIEKRSGKGAALRYGFKHLTTSHVVIHDADLEYFPRDLVKMYNLQKENPNSLILGSRFVGEGVRKNIYRRTYYSNKLLSYIFSMLNNIKVTDVATCYKMMPVDFLSNMNINQNGFAIEIEIIAKFLNHNKSIYEIGIDYEGRTYAEGKKIKFIDGINYIFTMIKYRILN